MSIPALPPQSRRSRKFTRAPAHRLLSCGACRELTDNVVDRSSQTDKNVGLLSPGHCDAAQAAARFAFFVDEPGRLPEGVLAS